MIHCGKKEASTQAVVVNVLHLPFCHGDNNQDDAVAELEEFPSDYMLLIALSRIPSGLVSDLSRCTPQRHEAEFNSKTHADEYFQIFDCRVCPLEFSGQLSARLCVQWGVWVMNSGSLVLNYIVHGRRKTCRCATVAHTGCPMLP